MNENENASDQEKLRFAYVLGVRLSKAIEIAIQELCDAQQRKVEVTLSLTDGHFNFLARVLLTLNDCPRDYKSSFLAVMSQMIMSLPLDMITADEFVHAVGKAWNSRKELYAP